MYSESRAMNLQQMEDFKASDLGDLLTYAE